MCSHVITMLNNKLTSQQLDRLTVLSSTHEFHILRYGPLVHDAPSLISHDVHIVHLVPAPMDATYIEHTCIL